jgi:hypothetical protein
MGKGLRGVFSEDQIRKAQEDKSKRIIKENRERVRLQCECNHIDAKTGKDKLKQISNGVMKCKLCGMEIISDPKVLNSENIAEAVELILSANAILRHEMELSDKYDGSLVAASLAIAPLSDIFKELEDKAKGKRKEKDQKKNNNNKKDGNKGNRTRVRY